MKRAWVVLSLVLFLFGLTHGIALAQDFPRPKGFVNDFAYLLSEQARAQLEARLTQLEMDTSAELAVVTIVSLDGYAMEEYAAGLFEEWGIGQKDKDNGVLFIVALEEAEVRIEVGYGLEGIITDGRAGRILDNEVIPHFREGDFEQGILAGVAAIEGYIRAGTPPAPLEENPVQGVVSRFDLPLPVIIALGIITIYVVGFMARTKSFWLGGVWGLIVGIVLGLALGGLLVIILLPIGLAIVGTLLDLLLSRNYRARRSRGQSTGWITTRGGFSGSGRSSGSSTFGGFGGGRSGGGGAGRRW